MTDLLPNNKVYPAVILLIYVTSSAEVRSVMNKSNLTVTEVSYFSSCVFPQWNFCLQVFSSVNLLLFVSCLGGHRQPFLLPIILGSRVSRWQLPRRRQTVRTVTFSNLAMHFLRAHICQYWCWKWVVNVFLLWALHFFIFVYIDWVFTWQ